MTTYIIGVTMKHIVATIEVDMGLYCDESTVDRKNLLGVLTQSDRSLMLETVLQITIKDVDTGLITHIIGLEDEA